MELAHTKSTQLQQTYSDISPHNIQPILVLWGHLQTEAHLGHWSPSQSQLVTTAANVAPGSLVTARSQPSICCAGNLPSSYSYPEHVTSIAAQPQPPHVTSATQGIDCQIDQKVSVMIHAAFPEAMSTQCCVHPELENHLLDLGIFEDRCCTMVLGVVKNHPSSSIWITSSYLWTDSNTDTDTYSYCLLSCLIPTEWRLRLCSCIYKHEVSSKIKVHVTDCIKKYLITQKRYVTLSASFSLWLIQRGTIAYA
jgi:hypothetical protein